MHSGYGHGCRSREGSGFVAQWKALIGSPQSILTECDVCGAPVNRPIRCQKCRFKLCRRCYVESCPMGGVHGRNDPPRPPILFKGNEESEINEDSRVKRRRTVTCLRKKRSDNTSLKYSWMNVEKAKDKHYRYHKGLSRSRHKKKETLTNSQGIHVSRRGANSTLTKRAPMAGRERK